MLPLINMNDAAPTSYVTLGKSLPVGSVIPFFKERVSCCWQVGFFACNSWDCHQVAPKSSTPPRNGCQRLRAIPVLPGRHQGHQEGRDGLHVSPSMSGLLGKREEGKLIRGLVFISSHRRGLELSYPLPPVVPGSGSRGGRVTAA